VHLNNNSSSGEGEEEMKSFLKSCLLFDDIFGEAAEENKNKKR